MKVLERIDRILNEALSSPYKGGPMKKFMGGKVGKASDKVNMECIECGKKFKKKIGPRTMEVKCPKCGSYDTEPI